MGMFEIKYEDLTVMIKHITELKPRVAISLLPGLPSYIIFMCVRYTDYINHERMLQALMLIYNKAVNRLIRRRMNDLELCVLWLSNTVRLIHNLKQYSGEPHFAKENTQTQNEQCLKNFDLSDFRLLMSDLAIWIFQNIMKTMEDKLQPLAVPAILEHEAISGLTVPRGRSASVTTASTPVIKKALDELLAQLTSFHRLLSIHGIDPELICQFFKQVFYFLCASSLNNLLLRKEFCHWSKGMQIRYNLSHLEQWAREQKLQDQKIFEMLAPIIQASQLLQARKTDADVDSVAEMCSDLTPNQIVKLLNLYTPADDLEARVPEVFIEKIQLRLKEQRSKTESTLLMDTKFTFSIDFPFNPSSIRLEDIEIPPVLNLPMLKKI
ncbi:hypothetical protein AAG570_000324 [Ranatra chinensis]|uniref:Dilute domain-containing protein n=1 Tax=Ranatra chinensis TaxID=642074 RepID=A0ABD0Z9E8_9HEMI